MPGWEGSLKLGPVVATNYREACQFYGDLLRSADRMCLLRELQYEISETLEANPDIGVILVDDVRVEAEAKFIVSSGGEIFLVYRPDVLQCGTSHESYHPTERYARQCIEDPESVSWELFVNDQPIEEAIGSLYASIRGI